MQQVYFNDVRSIDVSRVVIIKSGSISGLIRGIDKQMTLAVEKAVYLRECTQTPLATCRAYSDQLRKGGKREVVPSLCGECRTD